MSNNFRPARIAESARTVRPAWLSSAMQDGLLMTTLLVAIYIISNHYDLPPKLFSLALNNTVWGVDQALFVFAMLSMALPIYVGRRWTALAGEIRRRDQARSTAMRQKAEAETLERDQTRGHLNRKKQELDDAVDNMPQGLVMFDGAGGLVVCNRPYMEMYGLTEEIAAPGRKLEEIIGYRIRQGGIDADANQLAKIVRHTVRAGKPWRSTAELPDGRSIDILTTPLSGGGWVATHEDVSERRRAERRLLQTEMFLATVIENVPTTIAIKDARNLTYLLVNKAGERFFGLPRSQIMGKTAHELFPQASADVIVNHDKQLIAAGKEVLFDAHFIDTLAGERRVITARRLPIMDRDGEPQYLLSLIEDVTERNAARRLSA